MQKHTIMKKTLFILSVLVMSVIAACQKEDFASRSEVKYGSFIIEADMEQPAGDTKTVLNGKTVEWKHGDLIKVFNEDGSTSVKMMAQEDGASVQFIEVVDEGGEEVGQDFVPAYAIYPYSDGAIIEDGKMKFSTDKEQKYAEGTFGPGANVGLGKLDDGKLRFKNAFGVLKFWLKGAGTVERVVLKGNNNEDLFGNMYVALNDFNEPVVHIEEGQTDNEEIILNCLDGSGNGIDLRASGASDSTAFYFVVPAGSFAGGFTATAYCGEYNYAEVSTTKNNVVNRSKVKAMPTAKEAYILPKEYIQLDYLESTGTQYIIGPDVPVGDITAVVNFSNLKKVNSSVFGVREPDIDVHLLYYYRRESGMIYTGNINNASKIRPSDIIGDQSHTAVLNRESLNGSRESLFDGVVVCEDNTATLSNNRAYIFARNDFENNPPMLLCSSVRISGVKYFAYGDHTETALNMLLPCRSCQSGELGMYDVVEGVFYTNAGTGKFQAGSHHFFPHRLEYLQTSGEAWAYGPDVPANDVTVEMKFRYENLSYSSPHWLLGSASINPETGEDIYIQSLYFSGTGCNPSFGYGLYAFVSHWQTDALGNVPIDTEWHTLVLNKKKDDIKTIGLIDGDVVSEGEHISSFKCQSLRILARDKVGVKQSKSVQVEYIKYYNYGDNPATAQPIHNLVPVEEVITGEVYFYDEVTGSRYFNQGNGSFIAGPVVEE